MLSAIISVGVRSMDLIPISSEVFEIIEEVANAVAVLLILQAYPHPREPTPFPPST